jgi:bifunctional non-homologous end joining protein LigD
VRSLGTRSRKRLPRHALRFDDPLRYTAHRNREGEAFYDDACHRGWEGLIAKRADAPYTAARSRDWLKFKCANEQEFVIGGFTAPHGSRTDLGALLLGHYDNGRLRYAGKVGTGFTHETLQQLATSLAPLRRTSSPFAEQIKERNTPWVEPRLVAQVGFTEWTRDGRLRHPRYAMTSRPTTSYASGRFPDLSRAPPSRSISCCQAPVGRTLVGGHRPRRRPGVPALQARRARLEKRN